MWKPSKLKIGQIVIIKPHHVRCTDPLDNGVWTTGKIKEIQIKDGRDAHGDCYYDIGYWVEIEDRLDGKSVFLRREEFFTSKEMIKYMKQNGWVLTSLANQLKLKSDKEYNYGSTN